MSQNGVEFLKIQRHFLKVHIHCPGCQQKVKKLLRKIEGVYSVNVDAENQVVIVSGNVDSATLVNKLEKSKKHVELLSPSYSQILNQGKAIFIEDDSNRISGLNSPNNQYMFPSLFGNDVQDQWSLNNYLSRNIGIEAVRGEADQNMLAATDGNNYTLPTEDDMRPMVVPASFQGNGANLLGPGDQNFGGFQEFYGRRTGHENETPHCNRPSREMVRANFNEMVNHNYTYQPRILNRPVPLCNEFGFSLAPYTLH